MKVVMVVSKSQCVRQRFPAQKLFPHVPLHHAPIFGTLPLDKDSDVGVTGMRRMSFAYGREQSLPLVFEEEC